MEYVLSVYVNVNQKLPNNFRYYERLQDHIEYIIVSVIPSLFIYNMQSAFEWRAMRRSFIGNDRANKRDFHLWRSRQDRA